MECSEGSHLLPTATRNIPKPPMTTLWLELIHSFVSACVAAFIQMYWDFTPNESQGEKCAVDCPQSAEDVILSKCSQSGVH